MTGTTLSGLFIRATSSTISSALATGTSRVAPQGGIFEHVLPTTYDPKNPITIFVIQVVLVVTLTRLLQWPLGKLRQPPVIAEVIAGILLGPSAMGRVPGFTKNIFPSASIPALTLVANIGLVLFLFMVGIEVDIRFLVQKYRMPLSVAALGMALPFGLGAALAYGLYNQFNHDEGVTEVNLTTYVIFIGTAMSITAFPVLCRILKSLQILDTPVGVISLSAGVMNDVIGWILLALCVALMNAKSGVTAAYILLTAMGYCIFVAFPVRWVFHRFLRSTRSTERGPSQTVIAATIMLTLASAFFTQIIGIHAIFGAFLIGLICPHGIFSDTLIERIEDLVSVLLLPLYFALSGLNTNLGLLDSGIVWAYVVAIVTVAFSSKTVGGTVAARLNGLGWRDSCSIGVLMSCKGLVELIVLNIGLQAHILSTRVFTIFVVMALVTTIATTPLVVLLYPATHQTKTNTYFTNSSTRVEMDTDEENRPTTTATEDVVLSATVVNKDRES